jgi:hypothetical protein
VSERCNKREGAAIGIRSRKLHILHDGDDVGKEKLMIVSEK